jgi:hypothetical protein
MCYFDTRFQWNKQYFLTKETFEFLETPYKSSCSYYNSNDTIFNSFSDEHCVQQCIRYHYEAEINCSCSVAFFHGRTIFILNELDLDSNGNPNCSSLDLHNSLRKYSNFCTDLYPTDYWWIHRNWEIQGVSYKGYDVEVI